MFVSHPPLAHVERESNQGTGINVDSLFWFILQVPVATSFPQVIGLGATFNMYAIYHYLSHTLAFTYLHLMYCLLQESDSPDG